MCAIFYILLKLCVGGVHSIQGMIVGKDKIMSVVFSSNLYSVFISFNILDKTMITP